MNDCIPFCSCAEASEWEELEKGYVTLGMYLCHTRTASAFVFIEISSKCCLVPRSDYSALPMNFGSRYPSEDLDREGLGNAVQGLGNTKCTDEVSGKILVSYCGYGLINIA